MGPHANRRGIVALLAATATFCANDTIVKVVARACPLGEVLFVRGLMTCALVGTLLAALGHARALTMAAQPIVLARSVCEAAAALLFTSALLHMPLAELSSITLLSPLIITVLSVLLFGEVVFWRRWTAIGVGFVGAMFIVRPLPWAFDAWALLGVACAFASASRDLLTRRLSPGIPTIVVSFTAAVAVTLAGFAMGFAEDWRALTLHEAGLLAVAAMFLAAGNFLIVVAFRGAEVSAIAPFRYSILLWAGLSGYFVFGDVPDRWALLGATLIVGSGLYALHREAVRGREIASRAKPVT